MKWAVWTSAIFCFVAGAYLLYLAIVGLYSGGITLPGTSGDYIVQFAKNPKIYVGSVVFYILGGASLIYTSKKSALG